MFCFCVMIIVFSLSPCAAPTNVDAHNCLYIPVPITIRNMYNVASIYMLDAAKLSMRSRLMLARICISTVTGTACLPTPPHTLVRTWRTCNVPRGRLPDVAQTRGPSRTCFPQQRPRSWPKPRREGRIEIRR